MNINDIPWSVSTIINGTTFQVFATPDQLQLLIVRGNENTKHRFNMNKEVGWYDNFHSILTEQIKKISNEKIANEAYQRLAATIVAITAPLQDNTEE